MYALGDVCGVIELTPTAISAGRRLADRLFGEKQESKADFDMVPTGESKGQVQRQSQKETWPCHELSLPRQLVPSATQLVASCLAPRAPVIFSHPTIGTCGLSEQDAKKMYGEDQIRVYTSTFVNLFYGPWQMEPSDKAKTAYKLVCLGEEEKVLNFARDRLRKKKKDEEN